VGVATIDSARVGNLPAEGDVASWVPCDVTLVVRVAQPPAVDLALAAGDAARPATVRPRQQRTAANTLETESLGMARAQTVRFLVPVATVDIAWLIARLAHVDSY